MDDHLEANRHLWESWTRITLRSPFYDVEEFWWNFAVRPVGCLSSSVLATRSRR